MKLKDCDKLQKYKKYLLQITEYHN